MFTLLFLLGLLLSPTSRPTSAATTLKLRKSSSRSPRILHSLRRNSPRSPQRGGWRGGGGAGGGGRGGRYANVVVVTQSAIEGGSVVETVSTTQAIGEGGWYGKGRGGLAGDLVTTSAEVAASDTEIVDDADWGGGRGRWRMNNVQTDADSRDTSSYVYASSTGDLTGSTTRWIDDADSWTDSMVSTSTLDIITSVYISSTSPTAISSPPTSSAVSSLPTSLSSSAVSSASAAPTTTSFSALSSSSTSSSISSSPTGPATVGLDSQNSQGITYTVEVVIDGKKMEVIADTGSSMLWVPTTGCPTCSSAGMTISSITLPDDCSEYEQKYGMGSAVGCRTNVTVSLGDLELEDLSILGVKSVDSILAQQGSFMSGIIGFALDAGTIGDSPTFVSQLYNSGKIDSPEVGFYLPRGANQDGSVTLGSAASPHANANSGVNLTHEPNDLNVYQVKMDSFMLGGTTIATAQSVVVDTGTTNIYLPSNLMADIVSELQSAGSNVSISSSDLIVSCSLQVSLTISFGGKAFKVGSQDIIGPPESADGSMCLARLSDSGSDGLWIMGDAFLHNVYSVFNVQSGAVSFYDLA